MPPNCYNCKSSSVGTTWDGKPFCLHCAMRFNFTIRAFANGPIIWDGRAKPEATR
jgi:hypothetical protein